MKKPTLEGQKPNRKARVKSPKEKPVPTEHKPSPSVNGHVAHDEPFDAPPRAFYISAAQVRQEQLAFILEGYLPANTLTLITGESNAGKSTLLSALAAGVTRGRSLDGEPSEVMGRVLMFSPEEQVQVTLRARLEAENANLPSVFFGDYDTGQKLLPRMSLPNDCGKLCERLKTMHVRLVTIDPITSYLASGFNPSNDSDVRGLLDSLSAIAAEARCTILISRHYRKSTEGTPLDRIGGAAAWGHYPRTVLACGFDPDDPEKRVLAVVKCMVGKMPPSRRYEIVTQSPGVKFTLGEKTSITAADMGVSSLAAPERDALADAEDFLKSVLAEGPIPCNDLKGFALKNMIAEATLRRAKKRLGVESQLIVNAGDRYQVWKLADVQVRQ